MRDEERLGGDSEKNERGLLHVDLLRDRLFSQHPGLEVKSVDGFQGREKEAVVISMVRSNATGEVGFLSEKRRINVAVTRARRHLAVICDSDTVCNDPFIASLINYMTDRGDVLSAHQILENLPVSHRPRQPQAHRNLKEANGLKTKDRRAPAPMVTKEEKAKQFRQQLAAFLSDTSKTVLDFPSSLNSHDRMVVHEVAEELGLDHTSTGEGKARHIQITKKHDEPIHKARPQESLAREEISASDKCGIDVELSERVIHEISGAKNIDNSLKDDNVMSATKDHVEPIGETANMELGLMPESSSQDSSRINSFFESKHESVIKSSEAESSVCISGAIPSISGNCKIELGSFSKTDEKRTEIKEKPKPEDTSICHYCQRNIPTNNKSLHELHCCRQSRSSTAPSDRNDTRQMDSGGGGGGKGARKKDNMKKQDSQPVKEKKEKVKPKVSQVQKASEVLSKIPDDDFDALISTITALDGKCAFRKCKTLTTTLGRQCGLCDRRFCLAHLTPEIHGCGQAAKEQARRNISREGVLFSGSGVPDKKPNAARRANLEHRMEKKKEELAKARARQVDKKKS
ncbi:DNA-binding protein SMUBP-2 [Elysia marginata]|uniref:DNA-binding protein SMUBP-2 n=1 Tax=Elysia marginata TaxID=1093978 RepID=A0AAV4J8I2_9GAST|nr:DNA-binding protein SMUBP-2 [Elysia marginata]